MRGGGLLDKLNVAIQRALEEGGLNYSVNKLVDELFGSRAGGSLTKEQMRDNLIQKDIMK